MADVRQRRAEFGDFQTPAALAARVTNYLRDCGESPRTVLEPTCGVGQFLVAARESFAHVERLIGFDINIEYVERARSLLCNSINKGPGIDLQAYDFYEVDWDHVVRGLTSPVMVLGNLPWVTSSGLSQLGSTNLPMKSNFQRRNGLDAITGKANFDIAEYMLIKLVEAMSATGGSLAVLVKTTVARRFLQYAWRSAVGLSRAKILTIDANAYFGVSVSACLLYCTISNASRSYYCEVSPLDDPHCRNEIVGWRDGVLCSDLEGFNATAQFARSSNIAPTLRWRSGIKHDCAAVMELTRIGSRLLNGRCEEADLEDACLYPLLKGTAIASGRVEDTNRVLIVPQRYVGEDTERLRSNAPRTWRYLSLNAAQLFSRSSSIYKKQPRFAIFGVGDYTFRPYKVAISALHKKLAFRSVGPIGSKPVVFDDTVYFRGFETEQAAHVVISMLNSDPAQRFYNSRIFWDSKRPITTDVLGQLDLSKLAEQLKCDADFQKVLEDLQPEEPRTGTLF